MVAHDRRGHGRSSQASSGNDMNGYADDLAAVIETLDLNKVTLVGHSTGGGEVVRYIGAPWDEARGEGRTDRGRAAAHAEDRSESGRPADRGVRRPARGVSPETARSSTGNWPIQFYGANRPGAKVSQGILDQFWLWSMQAGLKNAYECIKAFSETDFTEDLKKIDVPTLLLHGEDDQIVPVHHSAKKSARLIKGAKDIYYPGAPHGLTATHQDQVNAELLTFLR